MWCVYVNYIYIYIYSMYLPKGLQKDYTITLHFIQKYIFCCQCKTHLLLQQE